MLDRAVKTGMATLILVLIFACGVARSVDSATGRPRGRVCRMTGKSSSHRFKPMQIRAYRLTFATSKGSSSTSGSKMLLIASTSSAASSMSAANALLFA